MKKQVNKFDNDITFFNRFMNITKVFSIKNIKNSIDFSLRNKIKFRRGQYNLPNEEKIKIFDDPDEKVKNIAEKKEEEFYFKYRLENLKNNSTIRNYRENLYIIELLEKYIEPKIKNKKIKILDIGSKDWAYAKGEHCFFDNISGFNNNFSLTGIEIDAYRLYTNLYARIDAANYHIKDLKNTVYLSQNFLNHNEKYDYITWFFPFITKNPLLSWGLPLTFFQPEQMLRHAYNSLNKNGQILILNQGENEFKIQQKLLEKLDIPFSVKGYYESYFLDYSYKRFIIVIIKN